MPIKRLSIPQSASARIEPVLETPEMARQREEQRQQDAVMKGSSLDDLSERDFEKLQRAQADRITANRQAFAVEKSVPLDDTIVFDGGKLDEPVKTRRPFKGDASAKRDLYQEVTDQMIQAIEEGTAPWQQPWQSRFGWPQNPTTGRPYHGINVLLLNAAGYQDPRWCSFDQAKKAGWQVRGGEKATRIYFYKTMQKELDEIDPVTDLPMVKIIPVFRSFPVFNLNQIEKAPKLEHDIAHQVVLDDVTEQTILEIIEASGANILHGRRSAAYYPGSDDIGMPDKDTFESDAHYYASLFHELAHWTGAESRLNRTFARDNKSPEYAREELRAEMASAMISMQLGLPSAIPNHEGYVASYLNVLKGDKKEIFRAAKDAETIARYILRYSPELREKLGDEAREQAAAHVAAGAPAGDEFFDASLFDEFDETPAFKP